MQVPDSHLICPRCSVKDAECRTCQDLAKIQEKERKRARDLVRVDARVSSPVNGLGVMFQTLI